MSNYIPTTNDNFLEKFSHIHKFVLDWRYSVSVCAITSCVDIADWTMRFLLIFMAVIGRHTDNTKFNDISMFAPPFRPKSMSYMNIKCMKTHIWTFGLPAIFLVFTLIFHHKLSRTLKTLVIQGSCSPPWLKVVQMKIWQKWKFSFLSFFLSLVLTAAQKKPNKPNKGTPKPNTGSKGKSKADCLKVTITGQSCQNQIKLFSQMNGSVLGCTYSKSEGTHSWLRIWGWYDLIESKLSQPQKWGWHG